MTKTFKVISSTGIHAKPATALVGEAYKYESNILLGLGETFVDMKSIIGVMSLGIYCDAIIEIKVDGPDEEEAMKGILEVLSENQIAIEI